MVVLQLSSYPFTWSLIHNQPLLFLYRPLHSMLQERALCSSRMMVSHLLWWCLYPATWPLNLVGCAQPETGLKAEFVASFGGKSGWHTRLAAWGLSVRLPNNRVRVWATPYTPVLDYPPSSLTTLVPIWPPKLKVSGRKQVSLLWFQSRLSNAPEAAHFSVWPVTEGWVCC